jgi:hypothetical protein
LGSKGKPRAPQRRGLILKRVLSAVTGSGASIDATGPSSPNPRRPIHYQQWYELFRGAGYAIDAEDPPATFLTQINRSPVVKRAGAPGVYALDFEAPLALRERLRKLENAVAHAAISGESAGELAAARERRAKLLSEARVTERHLEEALRSLDSYPN